MLIAGVMPRVMSQVGKRRRPRRTAGQARRARAAAAGRRLPHGDVARATRAAISRSKARSTDGASISWWTPARRWWRCASATPASSASSRAARDYTGRSSTANGIVKVAPVRLPSLEVNGIRVYDVAAVVIPDESLSVNLLGMSFLSRLRRFEMANGRLVMEQ